jgi:hypothetical protein
VGQAFQPVRFGRKSGNKAWLTPLHREKAPPARRFAVCPQPRNSSKSPSRTLQTTRPLRRRHEEKTASVRGAQRPHQKQFTTKITKITKEVRKATTKHNRTQKSPFMYFVVPGLGALRDFVVTKTPRPLRLCVRYPQIQHVWHTDRHLPKSASDLPYPHSHNSSRDPSAHFVTSSEKQAIFESDPLSSSKKQATL